MQRGLHRVVANGQGMRRPGLGAALLMAVLMASTSGCMGLIAARESVESLREPAYESLNNEKVSIIHQFTGLANYSYEYTNREAFMVNDQTTEISIYFKATFELSRNLPPSFWDNESRYVRATLTDGDGMIQWEQDVSEDANPSRKRFSQTLPLLRVNGNSMQSEKRGQHRRLCQRQFRYHRDHHQHLHPIPTG